MTDSRAINAEVKGEKQGCGKLAATQYGVYFVVVDLEKTWSNGLCVVYVRNLEY